MKSGGPWNLRGLHPETREAARDAARRSGMSVGEWLNSVIQHADDDDYGEPMRAADYDDYEDDWRPRPRRRGRDREAAMAREEIGEVNARLDRLTHQIERIARGGAARLTGAPQQQRGRAPPLPRSRSGNSPAASGPMSVDDAVAEIAERQRTLYGDNATMAPPPQEAPPAAPAYSPSAQTPATEPSVDISNLDDQLRYITRQIESLRPSSELQQVIAAFRHDLADIRQQMTGALPRRDVQSLEHEVDALAERLDHSRHNGADGNALAGLESRLDEVRSALQGLTPAESLVGFDDALRSLSQKVDRIIAREDPATLQQLETAISGLRGIVSHVASNDTLNKVADDVRLLAARVDDLASNAASGEAVSALGSRIDTLASALTASAEAGGAVPRELEKMLGGLIEKLEWVQLTHTDHAALGQLEDRLAQLMKRLDASDARLVNLESVERGLADLLVHLEQIRGAGTPLAAAAAAPAPAAVETIERDVAEIKRSEQRTQDSLEAVHGTVEQVVDRLALIEKEMHDDGAPAPEMLAQVQAALAPAILPEVSLPEPPAAAAKPAAAESSSFRPSGPPRQPIDPNLPPDHPLEPGSAAGPRPMPSAADRIAASEAVVGLSKPPVIDEPSEKPNFIAAARRAAQAAITAPPPERPRAEAMAPTETSKPGRLRRLLVIGGAMLILIGVVHIAVHLFQDRSPPDNAAITPPPSDQTPPPAPLPENDSNKDASPSGPLVLPVPGVAPQTAPSQTPSAPQAVAPNAPPSAVPVAPPAVNPTSPPANPARQSALPPADITGALPRRVPPPAMPPAAPVQAEALLIPAAPAEAFETLPATIGGPKLRAAATAGEAAAEFEVGMRFAEGHGVPPNNEQAARWFERAAKQGLAPAQFRLGGLYEKGIGVKKDLAMARDLYAAAASKGNGKAMHNLAVLYAEGIDGPADYRTAARWFRKAADYGIADSQYNLAILYARGIGVEQNYMEAYKWFALGANQGDNEAAAKRDEVATHLDSQMLATAQAAVKNWTAMAQPDDAIHVKAPPGGWDMPAQAAKPPKPKASSGKTSALDGSKTGL